MVLRPRGRAGPRGWVAAHLRPRQLLVLYASVFFVAGRARLQAPDLETWQEEGEPAWHSPGFSLRPGRESG